MAKKSAAAKKSKSAREREIADQAAEEVLGAMEVTSDLEDEDPDEEYVQDRSRMRLELAEPTPLEQAEGKDVFIEAYNTLMARGDMPKFYIYKNHEFIGVKEHPYSWENIQKDFGSGHFKIIAKSKLKGVYVSSQSQMVGNPHGESDLEHEEEAHAAPQTPPRQELGPLELLSIIQQQQDRAEAKVRQSSDSNQGSMATMMQSIVQMQQQSSQQFQLLFMEMSKMSMQSIQSLQASQMQMFEKVNQQIQSLNQNNNKGMDTMALLKLLGDAESRAEARATKMFEMVEEKAENLAEDKAAAMGSHEEKPSFAETLLKGFVPILAQAQGAAPQNVPQQPSPEQLAAIQHQKQLEAQAIQARKQVQLDRQKAAANQKVNKQDPMGFPQAARPATAPTRTVGPHAPVEAARPVQKLEVIEVKDPAKDRIFELVKDEIGSALLFRREAGTTASVCLKTLEKHGIGRHNVIQAFKWDDFLDYAKQFGLPAIAEPWLKEFYAALQSGPRAEPERVNP
jgi:hypothetical protein